MGVWYLGYGLSIVRCRIVIAAPLPVVRELSTGLHEHCDIKDAETYEEVTGLIARQCPDLVLVCYVFDEMRPFRLISYVREELGRGNLPIVLVRALPVPLGATQEAEIRESYKTLGVAEFVNFRDYARERGVDRALEYLRAVVLRLLPA